MQASDEGRTCSEERNPMCANDLSVRGDAIYDEKLKGLLEPAHQNEFVAIDVQTGAHAVGKTLLEATDALAAPQPDTVWIKRIGHRAVHRIRPRGGKLYV